MRSEHNCWNCISLCISLMLSVGLFGCGLDFGPGTIAGLDSLEQGDTQAGYLPAQFTEMEGSRNSITLVGNLRGLPAEYRHFFKVNPMVAKALIWVDDCHPDGRHFLDDGEKVRDLVAHLAGEVRLETPPIPVKRDNDSQVYFSREDAWNMYLAHVAHALKVEVHKLVPWSLADHPEEDLALFFDSRYYLTYVPSEGMYKFSLKIPGGRSGVTDWSPEVGYDFLHSQGMIGTQAETVYNFTNWVRENLVHANNSTPVDWDEYPGFPPVEAILYPPEGQRHWTNGCTGTTSLYIAILQSVNIPVVKGVSYFAQQGGPSLPHSRVEFPSLGIGLAHSDDSHNAVNRRGVNEVPVGELFYTLEELRELIDEPAMDDGAPSTGEQAHYNEFRRNLFRAYLHQADSILKKRARDVFRVEHNSLEDLLVGKVCNQSQCFWRPVFDEGERQVMTEVIDATLTEIGSGDIQDGSRIVLSR